MLALYLTAELTGVTDLAPLDSEDSPFWYTFTVQCTSCRETHPNPVSLTRFESNEMSGSRGEAHFVWRCKNCKREHSANIKAGPTPYKQASPPSRQKILELDCRGLEFTAFRPDGEWTAVSADSGARFAGIDLAEGEGEWYDYDEKAGEEVSVRECTWELGVSR